MKGSSTKRTSTVGGSWKALEFERGYRGRSAAWLSSPKEIGQEEGVLAEAVPKNKKVQGLGLDG